MRVPSSAWYVGMIYLCGVFNVYGIFVCDLWCDMWTCALCGICAFVVYYVFCARYGGKLLSMHVIGM